MATAAPDVAKITQTELNPCTVRLDIECTPEQVNRGFAKAIKQLGKNLRIPGFRPGHAPAKMIEAAIDPRQLFEVAADTIVREVGTKAVADSGLKSHGQPAVQLITFEKEPPEMTFQVKVALEPVVELADYKGLTATKQKVAATDEEVEKQIEGLRARSSKKQQVTDRGAKEGDMAVVNIKPEDGEARNFMIVVGQSFAGLDKVLTGMKAEDFKSAKLKFPENFQEKEWATKEFAATVTVRSLTEATSPELNDDFAKSLQATDVEDLKAKVRQGIQNAKDSAQRDLVNEQLLNQLLEKSKVLVSDNTWESVADRRLREMAEELQRQGSSLEAFAENQNMKIEEFIAAQEAEAKLHVERALVVERIFSAENMQITNDDFNQHFLEVAQENRVPQDQLEKFAKDFGPQIRDEVVFRSMFAKVMGFLASHATITEVEGEGGEAPAAKPAKTKAPAKSKKKSED